MFMLISGNLRTSISLSGMFTKFQETGSSEMQVKQVETEEEASKYTIDQVVLPLPSADAVLPGNLRDFYLQFLEKDGLTLESFAPKQRSVCQTPCVFCAAVTCAGSSLRRAGTGRSLSGPAILNSKFCFLPTHPTLPCVSRACLVQ
jgi:hypothetical protein